MKATATLGCRFAYGSVAALVAGMVTVPAALSPAQAAVAKDVKFSCTTFGTTFDYVTDVNVTATRSGSSVSVKAVLETMPGVVPVPVSNMSLKADLSVVIGGAAAHLVGEHTVPSMAASDPIPMPVVSGKVSSNATALAVTLNSLQIDARAGTFPVAIPCTLASPVAVSGVTVPPAPAPVLKAKSTVKVKTKVVKKKATVTVAVKSSRGTPSGSVKVTVKKGKKVVKKSTVTLRKGSAKVRTKKLKKGTYSVSVSYPGSSAHTPSTKKATFRVR